MMKAAFIRQIGNRNSAILPGPQRPAYYILFLYMPHTKQKIQGFPPFTTEIDAVKIAELNNATHVYFLNEGEQVNV